MSNLASHSQVRPANCQLPMSWYFDPEIFAREKKLLFDAGSNYIGHELMVPEAGDYRTLAWMDHAKLLVRNDAGVELLSNVKLHSTPLTNWQGLLFAAPRDPRKDLADMAVYRRWQDACLKQLHGKTPKYGALWATYLPGLTVEWYPNVLIVSNLVPRSPGLTTNIVEFYYPEEIVRFEREFVEAQKAAYIETALEDDAICRRLDRGRRALWEQGLDDAGPYQSPMEDTVVHFHEWLRRGLAAGTQA